MADDRKQTDPSAIIVPFGKHKGKTVAELLAVDAQYADWVTAQGWVAERFAELHAAILSRGAGTDDTPEHNSLQGRFLDDRFCRAAMRLLAGPKVVRVVNQLKAEFLAERNADAVKHEKRVLDYTRNEMEWARSRPYFPKGTAEDLIQARMSEAIAEATQHLHVEQVKLDALRAEIAKLPDIKSYKPKVVCKATEFEHRGVDVVLSWSAEFEGYSDDGRLKIELKPTMGDDYPTIMRQMRNLDCMNIVVGSYTGRGLSEPQVRGMFTTNGMHLVFVQEIEEEMRKMGA